MTTIAPQRTRSSFDNYKMGFSGSNPFESGRSTRVISSSHTAISDDYRGVQASSKNETSKSFRFSPRQMFIAVLVAVSVMAIMLPATTAFGRRSLVSSERPSSEVKSSVISVVVNDGDTLWSIARKIEPNRDPREIVDQLVKVRGTANVYAGETIEWNR